MRLNTSIAPSPHPKRLGVLDGDTAGFPNGRRLSDDVVDAALLVMEGALLGAKNDLSDGVDANDKEFENSFPYVAEPASGSQARAAAGTSADVRSGLADALRPKGGSGDTMLMAGSAAAGAAGVLLLGTGLSWWRRRSQRAY